MKQLDSTDYISKIDSDNMLNLIRGFSDQLKQAQEIGEKANVHANLGKGISNIVFSGLGGSAIGADFIRSFLHYDLTVPVYVNRHYRLPRYVSDKTLLIISSYSGDTEETLSSLDEGLERKARIVAISTGGALEAKSRKHGFPIIKIPKNLPPRAALGYSVIPLLITLSKIGMTDGYHPTDLSEAQNLVQSLSKSEFGVQVPFSKNLAKQFATNCFNKFPIIYAGIDSFDVVALRWRGQIEENGKAIASHHILPEMNHNELVGWKFPKDILSNTVVFILRDHADHIRVQRRMELTRDILNPLSSSVIEVHSQGQSLLARMFSLIHLGDWVSFYLAILNNINPTPVDVINFLKSELAKQSKL
jgi:glucose/mannose-6-phosphate isomerase